MARSAVSKNTLTPTAASNPLSKISIKVVFSTLRQDSQSPADGPLSLRGPPQLFSEEAEVKMSNTFVTM